ncbi:TPA: hypothetical protein DDW35_05310 [Candidatus Sumerlaeota bacterium]|jgi:HD-GYP domain-containing protein (c-di-GMP phosphodiesterase class II)|nr:hypothetical protein [Candidatus Sumerlaeota bacterium]
MTGPVQVTRHEGDISDPRKIYAPLFPDFLGVHRALTFDAYQRTEENKLKVVCNAGNELNPQQMALCQELGKAKRLYVRMDQKDEAIKFAEDALPELLTDPQVPLESKCGMVQNLTTSLSAELFDKPSAENIRRQKDTVTAMVGLTLRNPAAIRGLLGLTHHDYYTYTHSVNVGIYALSIAINHLNPAEHNLSEVASGFFLHDIGKSQVALEIINKNGPLNEEEWAEMRKHPERGFELLEREKSGTPIVRLIVGQHHERMDGRGYPEGATGEEIHLYARICSIADAYDALTTKRSYKAALPPFKALSIMKEEMCNQFDPDIFKTFVLMMHNQQMPQPQK